MLTELSSNPNALLYAQKKEKTNPKSLIRSGRAKTGSDEVSFKLDIPTNIGEILTKNIIFRANYFETKLLDRYLVEFLVLLVTSIGIANA